MTDEIITGTFDIGPAPKGEQDPKGPFIKCFDMSGKVHDINIGPIKEFVMPIIRDTFPKMELEKLFEKHPIASQDFGDPLIREPAVSGQVMRGLDLADISAVFDCLAEKAKETGEAMITASQVIKEIPLSDDELKVAKRLEDLIEDTLEREYDPKNPTKEIIVPAPGVDERIVDWIEGRYHAWDFTYDEGQFRMLPHDCRQPG